MKFLLPILLLAATAFGAIKGAPFQPEVDTRFHELERENDGSPAAKTFRATYDFSEHGGSTGAIDLGVDIPDNAYITNCWIEILTQFTSSTNTATIALTSNSSGDLFAATDANDLATTSQQCIPDWATVGDYVKMTAKRDLALTVASEDLTAGKAIVYGSYTVSD